MSNVSDELIQTLGLFQPKTKENGLDPRAIIQMALGSNDLLMSRKSRKAESALRGRTPISINNTSGPSLEDDGDSLAAPASAPLKGNDVQNLVQSMAAGQYGWSGPEWDALYDLIKRESGWNPNAQNPTSTAAGLFQFLDSTRKNYGISKNSPLQDQVKAGLQYIADRYKSPTGALNHWLAKKPINGKDVGHWYQMQTIWAKQFYRGRRNSIKRIYIHSMEAPEKDQTAENVARYFSTIDRKASAHICVDNNSEVRCVRDEDTAFHVGNDNSSSLGLELAGYAKQTRNEWLDDYGKALLKRAAKIVANWCRVHNIPAVWLDVVDLKEGQRGISSHYNGGLAFGGTSHWDPGPGFPHDYFIQLVKEELGEGEDWLTSEEAEAKLDEMNLRLIRIQNAFDDPNDKTFEQRIVTPIQRHATELRDSLSGLIRRVFDVPGDKSNDTSFIDWLRSKLP